MTNSLSLREARRKRDTARAELEAQVYQEQLRAIKRSQSLEVEERWGWSLTAPDTDDDYKSGALRDPMLGIGNLFGNWTQVSDRTEGKYIPFYAVEEDILYMRSRVRNLATFTSIMIGAQEARCSYVMHGEWRYDVALYEERGAKKTETALTKACLKVIDQFLDDNKWVNDLDQEVYNHSAQDGDSLVGLYPRVNGRVKAVRLEPEQVREPVSWDRLNNWVNINRESKWHFGVHTVYDKQLRSHDYGEPAGYHIVFDDGGRQWDYLPSQPQRGLEDARCALLYKRNAPRSAARGVSDYQTLIYDLEGEFKLTRNIREGATVQAAIAGILERGPGATKNAVEADIQRNSLIAKLKARDATKAGQSAVSLNVQRVHPGTFVTMSNGMVYHSGPLGQLNHPVYIEVAQYCLRRIGVRWNMPEYMISGDASNANFASTLVSESPFVKSMETDQNRYIAFMRDLLMRVLRMAYVLGFLDDVVGSWEELINTIWIVITPPQVSSQDISAFTTRNAILFDRGILDAETWAGMEGLDPDKVRDMNEDLDPGNRNRERDDDES